MPSNVGDISHHRSPVLNLENAISESVFRIAPERNIELACFVLNTNNLELIFEDGSGFDVHVLLNKGEIIINIATLEYLWASAHAYTVLYDEYSKCHQSGDLNFDTGGNERRKNAIDLLTWASNNLSKSGTSVWPENLPRPIRSPAIDSDIYCANELFLCATAWIILHEIAHIKLEHPPVLTTGSILEEKDADKLATTWILEKCETHQELRKRLLGIVAAILSIQGRYDGKQHEILKSHPPSYERIDYCLNIAKIDDNDYVYAFVLVIMQIQLAYFGTNKAFDGETYREILSEYLLEFSNLGKSE